MSCICEQLRSFGKVPGCRCDQREHPLPLSIIAGLEHIPRQLATFPEFRTDMLAEIRTKYPLFGWKAREKDDLGLMLLEMWAYVCDALTFYDEVISQEAYIRTANRAPSLRRLVALLGYLPKPAVASFAELAAIAAGRKPIKVPAGTAFRSGGFDNESPQVFEVREDTIIHPLTNNWRVAPPVSGQLEQNNPSSLYLQTFTDVREGTVLFIENKANSSQSKVVRVNKVSPVNSIDGRTMVSIQLEQAIGITGNPLLSQIKVYAPGQRAGLWTVASSPAAVDGNQLTLNGVFRNIRSGEKILVSKEGEFRWYTVQSFTEVIQAATATNNLSINGKVYNVTGNAPFTQLLLDTDINHSSRKASGASNWSNTHRSMLTVHYQMQEAGKVTQPAKTQLTPNDPVQLTPFTEQPVPPHSPVSFFLEDKNKVSTQIEGTVDFINSLLELNVNEQWSPALTLPVEVYGNTVPINRGETVQREILGSGNASVANQAFKLKKAPLTYLFAPTADNDQGIKNTLVVHVDGVKWTEVSGFFNRKETDQIYIVRQDDEGNTWITFGDGIRGLRLPNGRDNVIASYRFGAGAASPPARLINQIDQPVTDLQSVFNPLPAAGGADPESPDKVRTYAPKSVLILGRAVSIQDMQALALSVPGVRAAQAAWSWSVPKQRPVINVWFIGSIGIEGQVLQRLRSLSDPSTSIQAQMATAVPVRLSIDVDIDSRYFAEDVIAEIRHVLSEPERGILAPENVGIGSAFFRSRLFDAVLSVSGTLSISGIYWDTNLVQSGRTAFDQFARTPGTGKYFDFFETGSLVINGKS